MDIVYARIVTKAEESQIRKTHVLLSQESGELVPAFDATLILKHLELSKTEVKLLHKVLGGNGTADRLLLFRTTATPIVQSIPFRNEDAIRQLLHGSLLKEVKFENGTAVEPV